jgi:hypothetical protein
LKPLREGVSHTYFDYRGRCGRSVLKVTGMTDQPYQHPAFPQPDDLTTPLILLANSLAMPNRTQNHPVDGHQEG